MESLSRRLRNVRAKVCAVVCMCATALLGMAGCAQSALMQLSRETDAAEQRVYLKQGYLSDLKVQNQSLTDEKQRLLTELENKKMGLDDLNARLESLRKENALTAARTARERKKQAEAETTLRQYQRRLNSLANTSEPSADSKRKRIESLRKEIKTYLEMGLR